MGINVSKQYGGSGLDALSTSIIVEQLSFGCASTGIIVAIHNCLYADLLNNRGTEKQKEEFLRPFTNGTIGAFALSELGIYRRFCFVKFVQKKKFISRCRFRRC